VVAVVIGLSTSALTGSSTVNGYTVDELRRSSSSLATSRVAASPRHAPASRVRLRVTGLVAADEARRRAITALGLLSVEVYQYRALRTRMPVGNNSRLNDHRNARAGVSSPRAMHDGDLPGQHAHTYTVQLAAIKDVAPQHPADHGQRQRGGNQAGRRRSRTSEFTVGRLERYLGVDSSRVDDAAGCGIIAAGCCCGRRDDSDPWTYGFSIDNWLLRAPSPMCC
jgi:hypothetical protein